MAEYDTGVENQILVKNTRDAYSLLCANFYGNPSEKLHLIGITGTNGKTTTTFILKGIFDNLGIKSGLIGTVKNVTGDKEYPSSLTTPDSKELQRLFREILRYGGLFPSTRAGKGRRMSFRHSIVYQSHAGSP